MSQEAVAMQSSNTMMQAVGRNDGVLDYFFENPAPLTTIVELSSEEHERLYAIKIYFRNNQPVLRVLKLGEDGSTYENYSKRLNRSRSSSSSHNLTGELKDGTSIQIKFRITSSSKVKATWKRGTDEPMAMHVRQSLINSLLGRQYQVKMSFVPPPSFFEQN